MDSLQSELLRSTAIDDAIRAEIRTTGPMTFRRFMEIALYAEGLGYYRSGKPRMTRTGDFLTAPETHTVFGALLAHFAAAAARSLGSTQFTVVEQGAGTGALARSFLSYWSSVLPDHAMHYIIVEPSREDAERLRGILGGRARVVPSVEEAGPFEGLFLSNELPDAFPVHRVRRRGEGLVEVCVAEDGDRLVEMERPATSPAIHRYLEETGIDLDDGAEIEVNLDLRPWICGIAKSLERGYVLTIDYGYAASEVGRFPRGTLLAHYRHTANEDFLRRPGRQDLTAHVCWTALEGFGRSAGLVPLERLTQRDFLTRWGWKEYGQARLTAGAPPAELDAIDRLGRPTDGLGILGVLLQATPGLEPPEPYTSLSIDAVPAWR